MLSGQRVFFFGLIIYTYMYFESHDHDENDAQLALFISCSIDIGFR